MRTLWQDVRYSARLLLKHPGFTPTAVAVLTVGIGVNAGIFGIINGLMIRPLAGADAPGEVVGVFSKDRTVARDYRPFGRAILQQTVRINGQDFAVVGVAPQHFTGTTAIP